MCIWNDDFIVLTSTDLNREADDFNQIIWIAVNKSIASSFQINWTFILCHRFKSCNTIYFFIFLTLISNNKVHYKMNWLSKRKKKPKDHVMFHQPTLRWLISYYSYNNLFSCAFAPPQSSGVIWTEKPPHTETPKLEVPSGWTKE